MGEGELPVRERGRRSPVHLHGHVAVAWIAFFAVLLFTYIVAPNFFSTSSIFNVLRQAGILGIVTLGQGLVLLVAGVDLSVGATMAASLVLLAELSQGGGGSVPLALIAVLALGAAIGALNGGLITQRNVPPFVATLGMAAVVEGSRLAYTGGIPSGNIPEVLRPLGLGGFGPVPYGFMLWAVLAIVLWFVATRTTYGRKIYATGSSEEVSRRAGIKVGVITFSAYVVGGLLASIAGLVLSAYVGYVDPSVGAGYTLDSVAAAVVGGVAFTGGKGTVRGMAIGVLFITALLNLVIALDIDPNLQFVVRGVVIIVAISYFTLFGSSEGVARRPRWFDLGRVRTGHKGG
jgi:ribose/xylose/arabinose/galactoside ABC-type transport system permease subunit